MQEVLFNIRKFRIEHDYKQGFVGKHLGIKQTGYSKIENGEVDISLRYIYKLAELYKTTPQQLMGLDKRISVGSINNHQQGSVFNQGTIHNHTMEERITKIEDSLKQLIAKLG
jgi:transcriptional regulator with XRE-family HTH domain